MGKYITGHVALGLACFALGFSLAVFFSPSTKQLEVQIEGLQEMVEQCSSDRTFLLNQIGKGLALDMIKRDRAFLLNQMSKYQAILTVVEISIPDSLERRLGFDIDELIEETQGN